MGDGNLDAHTNSIDSQCGYDKAELSPNGGPQDTLERLRTAGSVSISAELFEKLYLNPPNKVKGDLRRTFGNPTPIGLGGFLLSLTPLSCYLMNWRGTAEGLGAAIIPVYLFAGGVLLNYAGVLEWILGNTFIAVVFTNFGAFYLSFGATLQPFYGTYAAYSPDPDNPYKGLSTPGFMNAYGFFLIYMALMSFIYLVCSLRTNLVFFLILLPLPSTFACLAASFWHAAQGNADLATSLQKAGGAQAFIVAVLGWYMFAALMLASVDAPITLPVFDLSTRIKGASDKQKNGAV